MFQIICEIPTKLFAFSVCNIVFSFSYPFSVLLTSDTKFRILLVYYWVPSHLSFLFRLQTQNSVKLPHFFLVIEHQSSFSKNRDENCNILAIFLKEFWKNQQISSRISWKQFTFFQEKSPKFYNFRRDSCWNLTNFCVCSRQRNLRWKDRTQVKHTKREETDRTT